MFPVMWRLKLSNNAKTGVSRTLKDVLDGIVEEYISLEQVVSGWDIEQRVRRGAGCLGDDAVLPGAQQGRSEIRAVVCHSAIICVA